MKRGVNISLEQAHAHQVKHGFAPVIQGESGQRTIQQEQSSGILRGRKRMNKTETEFSMILESRKRAGEILRYEFEGITLRFANVKYTPDFVVFEKTDSTYRDGHEFITKMKFIEVKGPFIKGNRERAIERFRHAKTFWPEFTFEMWQKKDGKWTQII